MANFAILYVIICVFAYSSAFTAANILSSGLDSGTNIANFLSGFQPPESSNNFPYEETADRQIHGSIALPPTSVGIQLSGQKLLLPQLEVLRLVEAFLKLKGEIINRTYALFNDNYDLIRTVVNLILGKLSTLHAFSLKGITVLRKIIEFSLNLFADWSINLPSVSVGASVGGGYGHPHDSYGLPAPEPSSFFDGYE